MMEISFEHEIASWTRDVASFAREQVPFATAKALTDTARLDAMPAVVERIGVAFDRPTPFTRRAVAYRSAGKRDLVSTVFIKDIQAAYLKLEEEGGVRRPKKRRLVVPVSQRLNVYGNMPRGSVKRMLARPDVFSGVVRGVEGIWQRRKTGLRLLVRYEPRTVYEPRFQFAETVERIARQAFPRRFEEAFVHALRTAR